MQYITLFGELLIFIPIGILLFFINSKTKKISVLVNISNILNINYDIIFWIFLIFVCLLFVEIIGGSIKYFFFKPRPKPMKYSNWYEKILAGSFPSLHSARIFTLFLFSLYFTNGFVSLLFFISWIIIAYSRIYLKKHYLIDILGGVVLSIIVFYFLFFLILK